MYKKFRTHLEVSNDKAVNIIMRNCKFEYINNAQIANTINSSCIGFFLNLEIDNKIVASNNPKHSLPSIHKDDIIRFLNELNKGNIINELEVEIILNNYSVFHTMVDNLSADDYKLVSVSNYINIKWFDKFDTLIDDLSPEDKLKLLNKLVNSISTTDIHFNSLLNQISNYK